MFKPTRSRKPLVKPLVKPFLSKLLIGKYFEDSDRASKRGHRIASGASIALISALFFALVANAAEFVPNQVIVKYKDGATRTRLMMDSLYDAAGVKTVKRYAGIMEGFEQLTLGDNVKVQDAIAALQHDDSVEYAQPNYIVHAFPTHRSVGTDDGGGGNGGGGGLPCIPGLNVPGCTPDNGGGGGVPSVPGGGGGGGGLPSLPGGGTGSNPGSCLIPGLPFPPGCTDGGTPGNPSDPTPPSDPQTPPTTPAVRPQLAAPPAEVIPPVADPMLGQLYGMSKIGAVDAWKEYNGSKAFIVADIDTGIDYNHEDLAFNVWRNPNPGPKNDVVGYDVVHDDGLPFDDNEHGTHTAGTIGAVGGNGKGVSGVAPRVSLMAVKFLSGDGSGTTADAIKAIDYAVTHGARVLSNSWGGKGDDNNQALHDAIDRAKAKDVLFIAAAGNDGTNNDTDPDYPAGFTNDNLIAVAATDESDAMAFFSNYGAKTVHLAAPGTNIYSTVPGNKYEKLDGTSMACPHVAGAAAYIWSKHPEWHYDQVKALLLNSVDKLPSLEGKTVTGGRLNVLKALRSME